MYALWWMLLVTQNQYEIQMPENSNGGRTVVRVSATDGDKGDFGIVFYQIQDPTGRFEVDRITVIIMMIISQPFLSAKYYF